MPVQEKTRRIFFALWPDDATRNAIASVVKPELVNHPAKKVPLHNWHLTLAFMGNVTTAQYECATQYAAGVRGQPFELVFDTFGYFPKPRVAWLGCSSVPAALQALVTQLNTALAPCNYTPEFRHYAPHLTLLRKADRGVQAEVTSPVHWQVNEFVLVESKTLQSGSVYQVLQSWRLSSAE
jgi:2'-5' RNA ligase